MHVPLQVELNQPDGVDVYDFLQLVRSNLNVEETATGCIGAEIDDLYLEDESVGGDLSPLRDSEMPTFDDKLEFEDNQRECGWDNDSTLTAKSNGWVQATDKVQSGDWDQSINKTKNADASLKATDSNWSSWAKSEVVKESTCSKRVEESPNDVGWGAKEQSEPSASWGKTQDAERDTGWGAKKPQSSWKQPEPSAWGKMQDAETDSGWGAKAPQSSWKQSEPSALGKMQDSEGESSWKKSGSSSALEKKLDPERDSLPTAKSSDSWDVVACKDQNIGASKTSDSAWSAWSNSEGGKEGGSPKVENNSFGASDKGHKNKRSRPPRPAEISGGTGLFTKTRQRLDLFTAEEQDILSDVEPMMEAIRRIMNQTG